MNGQHGTIRHGSARHGAVRHVVNPLVVANTAQIDDTTSCNGKFIRSGSRFVKRCHKSLCQFPRSNTEKRWNVNILTCGTLRTAAGSLDGKHVVLEKPSKSGSQFYDYKHRHSIVLIALVDANYIFITVDVDVCGRNSDGGIFKSSALGKMFNSDKLNLPGNKASPNSRKVLPHIIVSDAAFPLKDNLMRS
ncbi:hypothetical protein PR048_023749 [Dryococelus australis]|uniref:DDE Tnp4 domain-containing protein n=1 Tax=Dryococelus australis TaxID=614101 RepID=A0ABQ9GUZ3_9NEOP|nr:hypothetical protein PR048_023749 [Dryococelus australis]